VLVHHAPYIKNITIWKIVANYGWIGVDVFLCLSAFLFAKLLFAEHKERGEINIIHFYFRRALRIWPLYFFFTSAMLVYFIATNEWTDSVTIRLLGLLTFTDNLFSIVFGYNVAILYVAHLWTISYEEQVYLFIPWILRFLYRQKKNTVILILGSFTLLGTIIRAAFVYYNLEHPIIWVLPLTHFESVVGGMIIGLGLFDQEIKKIPSWIQLGIGITIVYAVTLLPNVNQIQWKLMLTYPLVGIGVSLILSAVMQGGLGHLSTWMKNRILGYLGKISFGLYVYHIFILENTQRFVLNFISPERVIVFPTVILTITLIFTILISAISYQILETPFQKFKSRFTYITSRSI
jgi:peptidoglycan/LPS O-acetylase OafA/YrhL